MIGMQLHDQIAYLYNQAMWSSEVKTEAIPAPSSSDLGQDSFGIKFDDEFESKHLLTQTSKEENPTVGKWSHPLLSPHPAVACL